MNDGIESDNNLDRQIYAHLAKQTITDDEAIQDCFEMCLENIKQTHLNAKDYNMLIELLTFEKDVLYPPKKGHFGNQAEHLKGIQ